MRDFSRKTASEISYRHRADIVSLQHTLEAIAEWLTRWTSNLTSPLLRGFNSGDGTWWIKGR